MKKTLITIGIALAFLVPNYSGAITILFPSGGGTGISTTTAGNVGKFLQVQQANPLVYTFGSASGGGSTTTINGQPSPFTFTSSSKISVTNTGSNFVWNLIESYLTQGVADTLYYPLNSNPAGYLSTTTGNWLGTWQSKNPSDFLSSSTPVGGTNFWTLSGTLLYPTSTGYLVGIGTTTPAYPLSVVGTSSLPAILTNQIQFATSFTPAVHSEGMAHWNGNEGTLAIDVGFPNQMVNVSLESVQRVVNKTGVTIPTGSAVYISGVQGNRPTIALAQANASSTSRVFGITRMDIANNLEGLVTIRGKLSGIDTRPYGAGNNLYLSPTTAGALVTSTPAAPNFDVPMGESLNSTPNGDINIHIDRYPTLEELSDVDGVPPMANGVLQFYPSTGVWNATSTPAFDTMYATGTVVFFATTTRQGISDWIDLYATSTPPSPAASTARIFSYLTQGNTRPAYIDDDGKVITIGRDNFFIVRNTSGVDIATTSAVYVTGSTGAVPNVSSSIATATSTMPAIGLAMGTIANNNFGYVMNVGILNNVDTSAFTTGKPLYLSPTTAGGLTATRPSYPNLIQRIGSVLNSGIGNGSLMVMIAPAVLGMDTGTISSTFNIGGTNAVTTSSVSSYALTGAIAGNGITVSSSTGVLTITNNQPHVTSTITAGGTATGNAFTFATSGPLMSIACATGTCTFTTLATSSLGLVQSVSASSPLSSSGGLTPTITFTGTIDYASTTNVQKVLTFPLVLASTTQAVATTTTGTLSFRDNSGTLNYLNAERCIPFTIGNTASSTTVYDNAQYYFPTTSTLTRVAAVQAAAGDVYKFNLIWSASRTTAAASTRHAFSGTSTSTNATTTTQIWTTFASSTIDAGMTMRLYTDQFSSSSEFMYQYCWKENQ